MKNNGNNSYKPTPIGGKQRTATRFYGSSVTKESNKTIPQYLRVSQGRKANVLWTAS